MTTPERIAYLKERREVWVGDDRPPRTQLVEVLQGTRRRRTVKRDLAVVGVCLANLLALGVASTYQALSTLPDDPIWWLWFLCSMVCGAGVTWLGCTANMLRDDLRRLAPLELPRARTRRRR